MRIKIIVTAVVLSLAVPAAAEFRTIQKAHELSLDYVRLPQSASGTISYKKCGECPYETKRLAADVVWRVNGQPTTYADFAARVAEISRPAEQSVTVRHHLEKDQVTRVSIAIR